MSISPVLLLKTYNMPAVKTKEGKQGKSSLQQLFDNFSNELKASTPRSVKLEIIPLLDKSPQSLDISPLTEVIVYPIDEKNKTGEFIDIVYVLARNENDETNFTILPSSSTTFYNIKQHGKNAKMRTEALTAIANALFKVSNSNVCITTSDKALFTNPAIYNYFNSSKPPYTKHDLLNVLEDSKFTLFKKDFIPELENIINSGDVSTAWFKDFGDSLGYSESDQPFSLSSSSSSNANTYYLKSISEALRNMVKERS